MDDINLASNEANEEIAENPSTVDSVEVAQAVPAPTVKATSECSEKASPSSAEPKSKEPIDEELSIVIDDDDDSTELISPPRKSARLEAKRRDSTSSNTESELGSRKITDSPVPKRRSVRLNSTSSQDTPPAKIREESIIKKMPTITEHEKSNVQDEIDSGAKKDKNNSDQTLVDELAAAFVEEFIE